MKYHITVENRKLDPTIRHDIGAIHEHHMCAIDRRTGASTCYGDSGGPLMYKNSNARHFVIGITSGIFARCGHIHSPGLFTKLADFRDFLMKHAYDVCVKDSSE